MLTDLKTGASFPTAHPLHPVEPRFRPSPAVTDILKQADVVLINGDPTTRPRDMRNIEVVFKQGWGYDPKKLIDTVRGA